jgi:hypothetical protein
MIQLIRELTKEIYDKEDAETKAEVAAKVAEQVSHVGGDDEVGLRSGPLSNIKSKRFYIYYDYIYTRIHYWYSVPLMNFPLTSRTLCA